MSRPGFGIWAIFLAAPVILQAQFPFTPSASFPRAGSAYAAPDPMGGGGAGGGGQEVYHALHDNPFSRLMLGAAVSSLGIGAEAGTNFSPKIDLRLFGNYINLTHNFTQSGFRVALNIGMANAGAKVDFYPLARFPLRISPGYLYFNQNRVAAQLHAEIGATFTINNVDYASDNRNPVYGTGRLVLGGRGLILTAGWGHFLSHTRKRLTFPFEAGAAFIDTPAAQFSLYGEVCSEAHLTFCEPAAQFPTFASNLAAQVKSWNQRVAPFHIYPIVEGGVAYSFSLRHRGVE